jgi:glycosyltransferase involved in cell wall biosynthesis
MTRDNKISKKIVHIIPSDALGGVEVAAIRAQQELKKSLNYELYIIKPRASGRLKRLVDLCIILQSIFREPNPVIITSLWPSHVLGLFISIIKANVCWVPFYHSSVHFGVLDSIFSRLSIRFCREALVDSGITKEFVQSFSPQLNIKVVPYIFAVLKSGQHKKSSASRPIDFIWVGRDDKNKNLVGFVKFCEYLKNIDVKLRIAIISSNDIHPSLLTRISLTGMIVVYSDLSWEETQYYLSESKLLMCTSFKEGFSMVAYEGLCNGCLPCGSLVGEVHQIINRNTPGIDNFSDAALQRFYLEAIPFLCNVTKRVETLQHCTELLDEQYPKDYVQSFVEHIKAIVL